MASLEEIRAERLRKLKLLDERGMPAYPAATKREGTLAHVKANFGALAGRKKGLSVVGRVTGIRGQGAIAFVDLYDGTEKLQALFKKGEVADDLFALFRDAVDMGDFIEVRGNLFLTKTKEKTILAKEWRMLAKSLRPLPDKWHGLQDVEERFRRRYLDMLMAGDVRDRFLFRSRMVAELRGILHEAGYCEVETPMLQPLAGGALAEPFVTHHNALDIDLNLRIAPELYLKMLLVGGMSKVYELGRNFRNEGIDVTHNPEFTMLEFYESFADASAQMVFVEKMLKMLLKRLTKKSSFIYDGTTIQFGKKFGLITFYETLKRYALIPRPESVTLEEVKVKAHQFGIAVNPSDSIEKLLDHIYKKMCRPRIVQPTFIVDFPVGFSPFAKRNERNPALIDRFQLVVGGLEVVNAFSELNDPLDQRARYEEQDRKRRAGEGEVSPSDEAYLEAMEYGMPPAGGVGIGVDRLVMLFTDTKNIREVILFPTLRPKRD